MLSSIKFLCGFSVGLFLINKFVYSLLVELTRTSEAAIAVAGSVIIVYTVVLGIIILKGK